MIDSDPSLIIIDKNLAIPLSELRFRFARSGGPGGQHVNRSETQVELLFDVANSPSLSLAQRDRITSELGSRIDTGGIMHIVSSGSRSQHRNRGEAITRFVRLLQHALRRRKIRRRTKPSLAVRQRRLDIKRRQSRKKNSRRTSGWDE